MVPGVRWGDITQNIYLWTKTLPPHLSQQWSQEMVSTMVCRYQIPAEKEFGNIL